MYFVTINTKNRKHYFGDIAVHPTKLADIRPTEIGKIAFSEWYKSMELRPDMNIELGEFVVMPNHIHGIIIIGANQYNRTSTMNHVASPRKSAMLGGSGIHDSASDINDGTSDINDDVPPRKSAMLGGSGIHDSGSDMPDRSDTHDGTSDINDDATPRKSAMLGGSGIHDSGSDMPDRSDTHDGTSHIHNTASAINRGCGRDAKRGVSTNQFAPQSKNLSSIIRGYKSAVTTFARKNGIEFDWQPLFHEHIIRDMAAYHRISNYIINNPEKWMNKTSNKR
jgi:REP element-mobilizing transposase RayT